MDKDNPQDPADIGDAINNSTGSKSQSHNPAGKKAASHQEIEKTVELNDVNIETAQKNLPQYERLLGVSEDAFEQPTTSRKELWSYYLYYNGDSGVGPNNYAPTLYVLVYLAVVSGIWNF